MVFDWDLKDVKAYKFFLVLLFTHTLVAADFDELFCHQERIRLKALVLILEGDGEEERVDLPHHRVYLNPHKILVTDHGLFYVRKCEKIFLPALFSDHFGCFLHCTWEDLAALSDIEGLNLWWCRGCGRLRSMDKFGCCCRCGRRFEEFFHGF